MPDAALHSHQNKMDLSHLNPAQREAVQETDGPLLVLAGAGTGKTRVLTTRIAHILSEGLAFPAQILAVTFTNKAASEMRERVEAMVGPEAAGVWLGTFHSICLRLLRRHAELVGLPSDFTVLDDDDQLRLLKQIANEEEIDAKRYPPKLLAAMISGWKDKAMTPEEAEAQGADEEGLHIYRLYQERLKLFGVADFDDLIMHCITVFRGHPDILAEYHRRFQYILVDEYQDTNVAQYLWLRLLAQGNRNICCVGEDDQSINGWRGAEVQNILRFEKDFSGAKVIRLEHNYRSTPDILGAASDLIAKNEGRLGKTLFSDRDAGERVRVVSLWDDRAEAAFIAQEIEAAQQLKRHTLDEMAVLVRAGHQTRALEECFMSHGISYRIIGGLRFYERMEIKDAIAYMRATVQPQNDLAFERIVNIPKRGIGPATLNKIRTQARLLGIGMAEVLPKMLSAKQLKGKTAAALEVLATQMQTWRGLLATESHVDVVARMLKDSGYMRMWQEEKTPEAQGRVENLQELLHALEDFNDIGEFLEHVSLVMDGDERIEEPRISIMTMHGAKGLEFDTVFLTGWEEGLFPSQRAVDEKGAEGLEEERRLAYVGMTRARKHLTITYAASRYIYGQTMHSIPSRFIEELPEEHIEIINAAGPRFGSSQRSEMAEAQASFLKASTKPKRRFQPQADFYPGKQVEHKQFGAGVVTKVDGDHITVAFKHSGIKTLLSDYLVG